MLDVDGLTAGNPRSAGEGAVSRAAGKGSGDAVTAILSENGVFRLRPAVEPAHRSDRECERLQGFARVHAPVR